MDFEIRKVRTIAQGPKQLRAEREEYFRLVKAGCTNREACRIVGVNERTGREWRNGRWDPQRLRKPDPRANARSGRPGHTGRAPVLQERGPAAGKAPAPAAEPSRYLSPEDRIHIADRLGEKATIRQIAVELGRSPSTVSREIRRNRTVDPRGQGHYRPFAAHARADARRPRPKRGKIGRNPELRDFIQDHLDLRWSPE